MKNGDHFLSFKLDTLQFILALQEPKKLAGVLMVLEETESTPQSILDRIDHDPADSKTGQKVFLGGVLRKCEKLESFGTSSIFALNRKSYFFFVTFTSR